MKWCVSGCSLLDARTFQSSVRVSDGDSELVAWPGEPDQLDIIYELDYGADSPVGHQVFRYSLQHDSYVRDIAPARTFVTQAEADGLRSAGLGTHLTYKDSSATSCCSAVSFAGMFMRERAATT